MPAKPLMPAILAFGAVLSLPGTGLANEDDHLRIRCARVDTSNQCTLYSPSLLELFAHPNRYQGKRVRVWGYVRLEFETTAIYLSKDAHDARVTQEALWIRLLTSYAASEKSRSGPAYVEGIFDGRERGHFSLYVGGLVDVKAVTFR